MEDSNRIYVERSSMYHLLQTRSRRQRRVITKIIDTHGTFRNTHIDITKAFVQFFTRQCDTILAEERCVSELGKEILGLVLPELSEEITQPFTEFEHRRAIGQGAKRKSPRLNGLTFEFYIKMWDNIKENLKAHSTE
jgi:hypothetical protein